MSKSVRFKKEAYPAFKALTEPGEEAWSHFVKALTESYPSILGYEELLSHLMLQSIKPFTPELIRLIIGLGESIYGLADDMGCTTHGALEVAISSLTKDADFIAWIGQENFAKIPTRLSSLVSTDAVFAITRIEDVIKDADYLFGKCRILTELRPVFGRSVEEDPIAYSINHSLKIAYSKDFEQREFFVSLSDERLASLAEQIARAKSKSVTLRKMLTAEGKSILETTGAEDV